MKKKYLRGLLAISAGFAAILASCAPGGEPTEGSSEEYEEACTANPEDKVAITWTSDFKTVLSVGETVDYSRYIKVSGTCDWTITSNSKTIEINGRKITAVSSGSFKITVTAGTVSRNKSGKVLSALEAAYYEDFGKASFNYTVKTLSSEDEGATFQSDDTFIVHNENYISLGNAQSHGGFVVARDGNAYQYSYANGVVTPKPGKFSADLSLVADLGNEWNLTYDVFDVVTNEDDDEMFSVDMAQSTSNAAYMAWFCVFGVNNFSTDGGAVAFNWADYASLVVFQGNVDGEEGWVFAFVGKTNRVPTLAFSVEAIGTSSLAEMEAYHTSGTLPTPLDYSAVKTAFNYLNSVKSYTLTGESSFSDKSLGFDFETTAYVSENYYYSKFESTGDGAQYSGATMIFAVVGNKFYEISNYAENGIPSADFHYTEIKDVHISNLFEEQWGFITTGLMTQHMQDEGGNEMPETVLDWYINPADGASVTDADGNTLSVVEHGNGAESAQVLTKIMLSQFPFYNGNFFTPYEEIAFGTGGEYLAYCESMFTIASHGTGESYVLDSLTFETTLEYSNGTMRGAVNYTDIGTDNASALVEPILVDLELLAA